MEKTRFIRISESDNVAVAVEALRAGEEACGVTLAQDIPAGHKFALSPIAAGEDVIKYAFPIGHATEGIAPGAWVHTHNVKTNLSGTLEYAYQPAGAPTAQDMRRTFEGYVREDGSVGIRNEIWIVNTVGCVNGTSQILARRANEALKDKVDGVYCFTHPYGCSQLGEDHQNTQRLLASMVRHPNAGGVLVLGLGCENNHIEAFRQVLGPVDERRVKFLTTQNVEDEIETGMELIAQLAQYASSFKRETVDASRLIVGLKCGGSDGLSGITANPLLGRFSDLLARCGGTTLLTEVPEMFGAEQLLMDRCASREVFEDYRGLILRFQKYYTDLGFPVYENPSPGNKAGGITTLEEKSLGCVKKGGSAPIVEVLPYGGRASKPGLAVLEGPGNDLISSTALGAAGCQLVLFTTGRGTPFSTFVPTLKIASNSGLAGRKGSWIDFDAAPGDGEALYRLVLDTASGAYRCKSEGFQEIAFHKTGVTL